MEYGYVAISAWQLAQFALKHAMMVHAAPGWASYIQASAVLLHPSDLALLPGMSVRTKDALGGLVSEKALEKPLGYGRK